MHEERHECSPDIDDHKENQKIATVGRNITAASSVRRSYYGITLVYTFQPDGLPRYRIAALQFILPSLNEGVFNFVRLGYQGKAPPSQKFP